MKIFMSWSGDQSRMIAEKFKSFLVKIIQQSQPYISSNDIDLGSVWSRSLMQEAIERRFGLIFITPENKLSPWIHYEAGCLIKDLDKDRVVPILFGLKKEDVGSPLSLFQMIEYNSESILELLTQINSGTPNPMSPETLHELFNTFFDKLNEDIIKIIETESPKKTSRSNHEILDEILLISRENKSLLDDHFRITSQLIKYDRDQNISIQINEKKVQMYIDHLNALIEKNSSQEVINSFLSTIPDESIRNGMIAHFINIKRKKEK